MKFYYISFFSFLCLLAFSCKKKDTTETTDPNAILQQSVETLTSHSWKGLVAGKHKFQDTLGGPLDSLIFNVPDTLTFGKTGNGITIDSNKTIQEASNANPHKQAMTAVDVNLANKYVFYSNRSLASTLIDPLQLNVENHYASTTGDGPEAILIHYYEKDSIIYFRNYCASIASSMPVPYTNYYQTSWLKK